MDLRTAREQLEILQTHVDGSSEPDAQFLVLHAEILLSSLKSSIRGIDPLPAGWSVNRAAG